MSKEKTKERVQNFVKFLLQEMHEISTYNGKHTHRLYDQTIRHSWSLVELAEDAYDEGLYDHRFRFVQVHTDEWEPSNGKRLLCKTISDLGGTWCSIGCYFLSAGGVGQVLETLLKHEQPDYVDAAIELLNIILHTTENWKCSTSVK